VDGNFFLPHVDRDGELYFPMRKFPVDKPVANSKRPRLDSGVGKWNRYQIRSRETSCSTMGTARTAVGWTGTESTVEKNGSKSNQLSWKIP